MRTPLFLLGSLLLWAGLATGCGQPKSPAPGEGKPVSGGAAFSPRGKQIWRVGNGSEPQDLDPRAITGVTEHKLMMALFEGLASEDPKDLSPVPGLAERWDISPDGLTYTFHLRKDGTWSDGSPLTAEDCLESYKRMITPDFASEYAYLIYDYVVGAKDYYDRKLTDFSKVGFQALDSHTLQVRIRNPAPYLMKIIASHYAWTPVPVKVIAKYGPVDRKRTGWTRPGRLVGSGPFILSEWSPNQKIVVTRNPRYWDAKNVKLDEIHFYAVEDIATEERMFRTGQLDKTNTLPAAKIDVYRKEFPDALRIEPYLGLYFFRCNVDRPPLNDKRVRRALALAIDRESIVKNVTRGGQQPAYAVSYPGTAGYTPTARLTGTVEEARRLLAEAGFPEGRGFPKIEFLYNTSESHRSIAEAVQQMWRRNLGIDITLFNQEWKVYLDSQHTRNFTLQRSGWIADYVDPHTFLQLWVSDNGNNDTNWKNADYDRLFQQSLAARTTEERYALYQKMDQILIDEMPVIPIYHYTSIYAQNPKVKGVYPTLLDNHPYKHIWIEP